MPHKPVGEMITRETEQRAHNGEAGGVERGEWGWAGGGGWLPDCQPDRPNDVVVVLITSGRGIGASTAGAKVTAQEDDRQKAPRLAPVTSALQCPPDRPHWQPSNRRDTGLCGRQALEDNERAGTRTTCRLTAIPSKAQNRRSFVGLQPAKHSENT